MNSFIEYYRRQWRGKLSFINYFYTLGPRTTNGNESYHSSLNTIIPNKKVDFRTAFMAFKESLRDSVCDYLRTDNLTKLKPREKKYVDAERGLIERREEIKALYDSNQMPSMHDLIKYCVRQAYSSVPDFEDVEQDPRFLIQPAEPVIPPIIPQIQPVAPVIPPMFNQQYRFVPPNLNPFFRLPFQMPMPFFQNQQVVPQQLQQRQYFNNSLPPNLLQYQQQFYPNYQFNPDFQLFHQQQHQ